jgi:hypothetical protein
MLRREHKSLQKNDSSEVALKATKTSSGFGHRQLNRGRGNTKFTGVCFGCSRKGHKKENCWKLKRTKEAPQHQRSDSQEHAFTVGDANHDGWLLDSGASSHMNPHKDEFDSLRPLTPPTVISIANGSEVTAVAVGSIPIVLANGKSVRVHDVLYVPELDRRLISISALVAKGLEVKFHGDQCVISHERTIITRVDRVGRLFVLHCLPKRVASGEVAHKAFDSNKEMDLWHARLGHVPMSKLKRVKSCVSGMVVDFNIPTDNGGYCESCVNGKSTVHSFPKSKYGEVKSKALLELVHSDIMGPMEIQSHGGARYVFTFIDDLSRYTMVYFMTFKSEAVDRFVECKALVENQFARRIKCIRTDNGGEYVNKRMATLCRHEGIVHQTTVPYTPQQNGLAERMNRSIMEKARCMLYHQQVDKKHWAEAVDTAVYLVNRTPCAAWPTKTPFEVCFGKQPDLSDLKVFGCKGFGHVDKSKRTKLDDKAFPCMCLSRLFHNIERIPCVES